MVTGVALNLTHFTVKTSPNLLPTHLSLVMGGTVIPMMKNKDDGERQREREMRGR